MTSCLSVRFKFWMTFFSVIFSTFGISEVGYPQEKQELIPRKWILGNPSRTDPQLSPDGKHLAFLAPDHGVMNLWIAPIQDPLQARVVTNDKKRGIYQYVWSFTGENLLFLQDYEGNENDHIFCLNIKTNKVIDLISDAGSKAVIEKLSPDFPLEIVVGINSRDPKYFDLYKMNILTQTRTLLQKNDQGFSGFLIDEKLKVRFAFKPLEDGGSEVFSLVASLGSSSEKWQHFMLIPAEDRLTTSLLGLNGEGKKLFSVDSRGQNTASLVEIDLQSLQSHKLAEDLESDIIDVLRHPITGEVQAARSNYDRSRWKILDSHFQEDFDSLRKSLKGELQISSRSLDDQNWIITEDLSNRPLQYHWYERGIKKLHFLFTNRPELENFKLSEMKPIVITASDGLKLVSYLSLPVEIRTHSTGFPEKPLPLVLLVHGGPWGRDVLGLNLTHQWLTNRGYAVLSVNFRGSTGFGKNFINAGNLEWGAKMHQDLIDAVDWAIANKIADPQKVGIYGGSYGGYSTLVGMTFTPEKFACGVDLFGPSNLVTLLNSIPDYWKPLKAVFTTRVGDPATKEGRALLDQRSPLNFAGQIRKPLLIGQGANDPRVKQQESDQIVQAMKKRNIPVTYACFANEGHGFYQPENRISFSAISEMFLSKCLQGRIEPLQVEDFRGAKLTVPKVQFDPGLDQFLRKNLLINNRLVID